jgi:hypothetical protein
MRKIEGKVVLYAAGVLVALLAGGILYYRFDPLSSPVFPKCPFLLLTGWKCPGCGSQRAIHELLHLDVFTAFSRNALLVCSLPYLLLLTAAQVVRYFVPASTFPARIQRPFIIRSYLAFVVLFWITRNLFAF